MSSYPQRKKKLILPAFAVLALVYIFISSRAVLEYPVIQKQGVISIPQSTAMPKLLQPQVLIQFETSDKMGLLDSSHTIVASALKNGRNILGPGFYIEAFPEQKKLLLDDLFDGTRTELPLYGYPFSRGGRIFILRPDQMAAMEMEKQGKARWSHEFGTPITAFSSQSTMSAWGTLDGTLLVVDREGNEIKTGTALPWSNSAFSCIYGLAISKDQKALAVIAGYKPLILAFFRQDGDDFKLVQSLTLEGKLDSEIPVVFSNDSSWLMAALPNEYVMLNTKSGKIIQKKRSSTVQTLTPFGQSNIGVLIRDSNGKKLEIFNNGASWYAIPVQEKTSAVIAGMNTLILVEDSTLAASLSLYGAKQE